MIPVRSESSPRRCCSGWASACLAPRRRAVIMMCVFAVFLYLLCDAVSGGVNFLPSLCRPLSSLNVYSLTAHQWHTPVRG